MGTPCTQITANQCKSGICDAATSKCTDAAGNVAAARTVIKLPNFLQGLRPTDPDHIQVSDVIGTVIKTIIGLVGSFALIIFIYGGMLWLISAGRKDYVDKGKKAMIWSAVGLAVVFASYILVNTVFNMLQQT